ncbi:MAG: polysaccharide deacetylase family protein [Acidobacteriota bacterium]|nr:polysaccharide deacetylase family protein [Acidobacteriota bacterium]
MSGRTTRVPFNERGGPVRGLIDLLSGRYPAFLFGASPAGFLPVFHFHEVTPAELEPKLQFLAENGYTTVDSEAIARLVVDGVHPGPFHVALGFDDAWASLWTVAGPLLRRYGFRAITYAIPERVTEADGLRPTIDDGLETPGALDRSDTPFATWPELKALHDSGVVDVQSHTLSHAMIFTADRLMDFVTPAYAAGYRLSRPLVEAAPRWRYQAPEELGAPLFLQRSRMSDGLRFLVPDEARQRPMAHVAANGGPAFFERPGWRRELAALVRPALQASYETADEQQRAIIDQLGRSREILNARLGTRHVRHICLPWGVGGEVTLRALRATGYQTAFSNRIRGALAVRAGDPVYRLKRLPNKHLYRLPRRGRSWSIPARTR